MYNDGNSDITITANYVVLENKTLTINYNASATTGANMVFTISDDNGIMTTASAAAGNTLELKKVHTVTFDWGNYKDEVDPTIKTALHGAKVSKPADPTRSGYVFMGWFIDDAEYDFAAPVTADVTVKAKWGRTVTFFNRDGSAYKTIVVEYNKKIPEAEISNAPTMNEGYTYTGAWHKFSSTQLTAAAFDFNSNITSDTKIYPGFIVNSISEIEGTWDAIFETGNSTYPAGTKFTLIIDVADNGSVTVTVKTDDSEWTRLSVQYDGAKIVYK